MRERVELTFLNGRRHATVFSQCEPASLFALQVALSRQIFDLIAQREPRVRIQPVVLPAHPHPKSRSRVRAGAFLVRPEPNRTTSGLA